MQRLRKCLGVDIGGNAVKIVEIQAEKAGVRVVRMARAEIDIPPGPMDADRIAAVAKVVRDLVASSKVVSRQAVFSVPGQSVFIRRIRMPRTTEERLHRIVAYEARQQIPFALDNSLMEYQVFDTPGAAELEVLLVAIKKDIVLDFMKIVAKTGLKAIAISVSSVAVFNFHVFDSTPFEDLSRELGSGRRKRKIGDEDLSDGAAAGASPSGLKAAKRVGGGSFLAKLGLGPKKSAAAAAAAAVVNEDDESMEETSLEGLPEDDGYEEVRAFINIGAQTFDLAVGRFGKRKTAGFFRSVPVAGNELSRLLQDKLGLESLAAAESVKRELATVVIPGREDESAEAPEAGEFTTQWADRVVLDIRKSFDFYISQPDGYAVDTITMSGGQARQRNLAAYIEDKLGIPVTVKEEAGPSLILAGGEGQTEGLSPYLVAIGLGLTGLGLGQVTVDFLPSDLKTIREFKKKNVELALMAACIAGMIALSTRVGGREMANMDSWLDNNGKKIAAAVNTQQQIDKVKADRIAVSDKVTALGNVVGDRLFWQEFLGMLESVKPPGVVLVRVTGGPDGNVTLDCETDPQGRGQINSMMDELVKRKDWVRTAERLLPQPGFSETNRAKQVLKFNVKIELGWKKTRLASLRIPLDPGLLTPTPAAAGSIGRAGPQSFGPGPGAGGGAAGRPASI